MKKIFAYASVLLMSTLVFTSCEKDTVANPTLVTPTSFVLNEPTVGSSPVSLLLSTAVELEWSQPQYTKPNAPVVADYAIQLGAKGTKWSQAYNPAADDEFNANADYIALDETFSTCKAAVPAEALDKALMELLKWDEASVPEKFDMDLRVRASVKDASFKEYGVICSNVVTLTVIPYYIELADAPVVMWYLVGNLFGGKWGSEIGVSALPMFIIPGYDYDAKTGTGELSYTNYFITGDYDNTAGNESSTAGFKIQPADFNWDLGMTGDNGVKGKIIFRNKGADGGHIVAEEDGYYTIKMNTAKNEATFEKYEGAVPFTGTVAIAGSFNDWSDEDMLPYNKEGVENHVWYIVKEFAADQELKFKQSGSWDTNWGAEDFPVGTGVGGGANIPVAAGKYCIIFNDITSEYNFHVLQ